MTIPWLQSEIKQVALNMRRGGSMYSVPTSRIAALLAIAEAAQITLPHRDVEMLDRVMDAVQKAQETP